MPVRTASVLTGILYSYEVMPTALQKIVNVLPLTQGINLLKASVLNLPLESVWFPITIMAAITVICGSLSIRYFKWE